MIILSASDLCKSYGTDVVLENISFHINEGDRVGIVGVNGAGKSTLLEMLAGELAPDSGSFFVAKDTTIGYLKQRNNFESERTVMEEVTEIFAPLIRMEEEIAKLSEQIAAADEEEQKKLWQRLTALQHEYENGGGYTYQSEITGVLSSMAFTEDFYGQRTGLLSGGERTRLALACLLLRKPDILFLDEPTNHLDIGTLKWLEQYLRNYRGTLVVISHDRYFLDQTCTRIFSIENHKLQTYEGNYTYYAAKRREDREAALKAYTIQQKEIRRQEDLIRGYKERGTEKLAKRALSREKRLAHLERLEKPEKEQGHIKVNFREEFKSGNDVLLAEGLSAGYEDGAGRELFRDVSFDIKRGDRICVVGKNGIGKTTLLRIIVGEITQNAGYMKLGHNVEIGYYDQGQSTLNDDNTVMEEIHESFRLYKDSEVRSMLGRFLFKQDMVFRQVGELSGGEKARLALLKLMMGGANLLILDEPTNHLDIDSKEAFEDALMDYPGTVITVTHGRYFLNRVPTRIFELTSFGINEYLGKYDYYVEKKEKLESGKSYLRNLNERGGAKAAPGAEGTKTASSAEGTKTASSAEGAKTAQTAEGAKTAQSATLSREEKKRLEAEERRQKREHERIMTLIGELEDKIAEAEDELTNPEIQTDHVKLHEISQKLADLKADLDAAYAAWEAISEQ